MKLDKSTQKGVALIMALMTFAIVSAIAASLMSLLAKERDVLFRVQENTFIKQQLLGGEAWAISALSQLDKANLPSLAKNRWLLDQVQFELEQNKGQISVLLADRHSCLNLNRLTDSEDQTAFVALQRLLGELQLDTNLADQIQDWFDADQDLTGANGHEDEFYQLLEPSYRSADAAMVHESELALWQMPDEDLQTLAPWLCFWPTNSGILLNRFPVDLQNAYLANLTAEQKSALNARVESAGFDTVDDFFNLEGVAELELDEADWQTQLSYVDAFIEVTTETNRYYLQSKMMKDSTGNVIVYGRAFGPHDDIILRYGIQHESITED